MATETVAMTYQDSLDALSKIADGNGNRFRIKVVRRPNAASSISQHVATFGDATWQHIADAESWLGPFSGGGLYILQIFDGADGRKQYGTITPSEITGAPRPPNPKICDSAAWIGPVLLSAANGAGSIPGGTGATALGSPFSLGGGSYFSDLPRSGADAGLASLFQAERSELNKKAEDLADKERRAELDALRREAAENAKRMEQRLAEMTERLKAPVIPPPALDVVGLVAALGAVAGPIIASMSAAATAARQAQAEIERSRLEREEKRHEAERLDREARAIREAEDRKAASSRPLIDPQILEIMDRQAKRAEEQASQFSLFLKAQAEAGRANMESQSVAQRTMLQTIADVAQIQLKVGGGEESPGIDWTKVISGVAAGLGALAQAKAGGPGGGAGAPGAQGIPSGQLGAAPPAAEAMPDVPAAPELDVIEDQIRKKEPVDQVVADLRKIIDLPSVKAEIAAEGGLEAVFQARLDDFASEKANEKYLDALQTALVSSGVFGA